MHNVRLGISSYTYGWAVGTEGERPANAMTAIDLIDRAVALGVGVVQIADNLPADTFTPPAVAAVKRHADAQRVAVELGTRGCGVEHLMRLIGIAHHLGSPVLRIVLDTPDDHPSERVAVERLRACACAATSLGVTLAVENHDRFEAASLRRIVDAVGPAAGICLDTVNSMGATEGPKCVVEALGPVTVNLHLKDFHVRRVPSMQGFVVDGCPAGEGILDIPWLLERLREFGRDCNAILEQWVRPEGSIARTIEKEARWGRPKCRDITRLDTRLTARAASGRRADDKLETKDDTMITVAILGAAGNMGTRACDRLRDDPDYRLLFVEPLATGEEKLRARGDVPTPLADAALAADVILLAIADKFIAKVAPDVVTQMRPDATLMMLDPAAAYADVLPKRADVAYFVTHPTHPPVFNDEVGDARYDYFGAGKARQSIVSALVQGPEASYAIGEAIAHRYFGPILNSHRVTLEQLAILEPAMSETCGATFIVALKEAMDEAVRRGVPAAAAKDFMLGHINVQLAIVFEQIDWKMSEGAYLVIREAMKRIFKPDWRGVFDAAEVKESVKAICRG